MAKLVWSRPWTSQLGQVSARAVRSLQEADGRGVWAGQYPKGKCPLDKTTGVSTGGEHFNFSGPIFLTWKMEIHDLPWRLLL